VRATRRKAADEISAPTHATEACLAEPGFDEPDEEVGLHTRPLFIFATKSLLILLNAACRDAVAFRSAGVSTREAGREAEKPITAEQTQVTQPMSWSILETRTGSRHPGQGEELTSSMMRWR